VKVLRCPANIRVFSELFDRRSGLFRRSCGRYNVEVWRLVVPVGRSETTGETSIVGVRIDCYAAGDFCSLYPCFYSALF